LPTVRVVVDVENDIYPLPGTAGQHKHSRKADNALPVHRSGSCWMKQTFQ
jgi:hypothetical protein